MPQVDKYFGTYELEDIINDLASPIKLNIDISRKITTPNHYAYLKISDGCDRKCAFCAIPVIKNKHKSKTIGQLVNETEMLAATGVKEIILIAQDLTYYGYDIYKQFKIVELIEKISEIKNIEWIRLHYTYPLNFTDELITEIKNNKKVCNYIDIPIQHISGNILKKMRRGIGEKETKELLYKIKESIGDVAIRTTVLTGFPGETEKDFNKLIDFIKEFKFDRLGVFKYSHEEDTHAFISYKDNIAKQEKERRANIIMTIQQEISREKNQQKIGKTFKTIIDRQEGNYLIGRTEYDSPEVDNEVIIKKSPQIKTGDFYKIKIFAAEDYDLFGKL